MIMNKVKTAELTGAQLDWSVALCEGYSLTSDGISLLVERGTELRILGPNTSVLHYSPSTDWVQGGPIIERERMEVTPWGVTGDWRARDFFEPSPGVPCAEQYGPTPLIAAMRCYVASKLRDEIELPMELLK